MKLIDNFGGWIRRKSKVLAAPLFAIVLGFLIGGLIIALSGYNPFNAIWGILKGGFGSGYYLSAVRPPLFLRVLPLPWLGAPAIPVWVLPVRWRWAPSRLPLLRCTAPVLLSWSAWLPWLSAV